jgi:hypothetical protein
MKTIAKMPASLHKAVKLGMSTVLATGTFAIIGANPAHADGACNALVFGLNAQCSHSETDFEVTDVTLTGSGFTFGAMDNIGYTLIGNSLQAQLGFVPSNAAPLSGTISYKVTLKNGRTFDNAFANITGGGVTLTNLTSSNLSGTATSTGGNGAAVGFSPSGLTMQVFSQTFSASSPGSLSSVGGIYNTTGPLTAPGPLPLLGVGAAFGFSRKLRRRIQLSA